MASLLDLLRDSDEARRALKDRTNWERKGMTLAYYIYHGMARKGFSPMHIAAWYERTEMMRILVQDYKAQTDPFAVGDDDKWTPLHEAVSCETRTDLFFNPADPRGIT